MNFYICLAKLPVIGYATALRSRQALRQPVLVVLIAIRFILANCNYSNTSVELILNAENARLKPELFEAWALGET